MYIPLSTLVISLILPIWTRAVTCYPTLPLRAVYMIANDATNAVVALPIAANGTLSMGSLTPTMGNGSNSIDSSINKPAAPDALVSQSSVAISGNYLFAVNAGSNTVTMFAIDPRNVAALTMLGSPVSVPGTFPNTIAASTKNQLVCVGTSGTVAGVSCTSFSRHGLKVMDALRPFELNQTTPPLGPTNTVSQVFFSNDESILYTTVKGDPTKNTTGFLASFNVGGVRGCRSAAFVSSSGTRVSPEGTAVLFGSSTIPSSTNIFVTDASFGGAVLSLNASSGAATVEGKAAIQGQKATCWVTVSSATKTAFVTDVGMNRLVEMSLQDGAVKDVLDLSGNGDPGLTDLKAVGNFIYALSPGNGTTPPAVTVVDVLRKKQIQHFNIASLGVGKNVQGMAAYF